MNKLSRVHPINDHAIIHNAIRVTRNQTIESKDDKSVDIYSTFGIGDKHIPVRIIQTDANNSSSDCENESSVARRKALEEESGGSERAE